MDAGEAVVTLAADCQTLRTIFIVSAWTDACASRTVYTFVRVDMESFGSLISESVFLVHSGPLEESGSELAVLVCDLVHSSYMCRKV